MLYSGIDLHRDNSMITTINQSGIIVKQQKLPNDKQALLNYFFALGNQHRAVVEATANWYWISDLLNSNGIDLILAHAKYLKAISYAKVKTDKLDSQTLANLLRIDMIPIAHQISPHLRELRDLMRARLKMVQKKTSCINSIHRLLAKHNCQIPEAYTDAIPNLTDDANFQMQALGQQMNLLAKQIKQLETSLHPRLIPNPDIQRLLWIPGIAKILAFTIYLEIDGVDRFPTVAKFLSYACLVPGADNSNRKLKHKSANKDGNKYLKSAFKEAAVRATQYYKEISDFYRAKVRRKHPAVARTLVAQELAKICYSVLKNKTDFNNTFKGETLSRQKSLQWPRLASPGV